MTETSQYQGSQAFNQAFVANEFVVRNTGSLTVSKALVNLRGVSAGVGLAINLSYTAGTQGLLGLPANWSFGIAYVVPGASLTAQGKTSVIDPDWTDVTGYQSGLRYVNDHGIKFQAVIPPQDLPSGEPGMYSYMLAYNDGAHDYYDATGKLLEHADLFGNHINYAYTDQFSGVFGNMLDHITDSFGQVIRFQYGPNAIVVTTPDGAQTTINWSSRGVENICDALGNYTIFNYQSAAGQTVIGTIEYPTGLKTQLQYTAIPYITCSGASAAFPAVSDHYHLDASGAVLDHTGYAFGTDSGGATFTGASAGYRMSGASDSLMDSKNTLYTYDVLVQRFDASDMLLAASRVYFNYLHLPTREEHYLIGTDGAIGNLYRALYAYHVDPDYHARSTNYAQPVTTQQFVYSSRTSTYLPLRQSTSSYDLYGQLVANEECIYDTAEGTYVSQMTTANAFVAASWGGQMPLKETYTDSTTSFQRQITYTLTADQKNIASATVAYRSSSQDVWSPWKTKSYVYDVQGRLTTTTLIWSPGVTPPPGSVTTTTSRNAYAFDAGTRTYTVLSTNAAGDTSKRSYDVGIVTGPTILAQTPLGEAARYSYDSLGRLTQQIDALGHTTVTTYRLASAGGINSATSIGPTGYLVATSFDALGQTIMLMDNGDPTQNGGLAPNRVLSKTVYDALGRIASSSDELGLITSFQYDSLSRQVQTVDPLGNISTTSYHDASSTVTDAVNGAVRRVTTLDNFGRAVIVTTCSDPSDTSITYSKRQKVTYDGFGMVAATEFGTVSTATDASTTLYKATLTRNVEHAIANEAYIGTDGTQVTVTRATIFDLFGNAVNYMKQTNYADGRIYNNTGNALQFDSCRRLVSITNQLGQVERYSYDADSHLSLRIRLDGTVFNYSYDGNGQLLAMNWPSGNVAYSYFPNGNLQTVSGQNGLLRYAYYLDGSAKSITYPNGFTQSYAVDKTMRVIGSTDASGATTTTSFDGFGRLAVRQFGGDTVTYEYGTVNQAKGVFIGDKLTGSKTITRSTSFDGFGQTSTVSTTNAAGQSLLSASYSYDATGRVTQLTLSSATCTAPAVNLTRQASYDGMNQLTGYVTTYAGSQPQTSESFRYDGNFNIIQHSRGDTAATYTYNLIDQLTSAGVAYDINGRMTHDGTGRVYTYDALDRLIDVRGGSGAAASYGYYPDGALANATTGTSTNTFYYTSGAANAIASSSGASAVSWTTFLLDSTSRRAAIEAGQAPSYYITSGDSTSLIEESAAPSALSYGAYGLASSESAPVAANKSFTWLQEYADPASGLIYLRARYYNPTLMSFMTMDNLTRDNRYGYCSGNPLNLTDPTGHLETGEIVGLVIGAVVGIAATVVTGGLAGAAAAAVFGTESIAASIGATALAGAVGSIAGDATNAAIAGQKFTAERALVDLASGAVGGAVGAGVGGYAGRAAMSAALAEGMSQRAITNIGLVCSGVAGGISGSAAAAGVTSLMTGAPFFSVNTAISMAVGAAAGVGGGFLTSGAYLGKLSAKIIPVPLSDAELNLIVPAVDQVNANLVGERLLVMAPQPEANASAQGYMNRYGNYESSQTLDYAPGSQRYDTVAAHGAGNTMFASVEYQRVGGPINEPNYVRPIKGSLFADYLTGNPALIGGSGPGNGTPLKLMTCFGAFSNAQTIANAIQRPVFAGYPEIDRYTFTNWSLFNPH